MSSKKYSVEYCKKIASKYTVLADFKQNEPRIFKAIYRHGWQQTCLSHLMRCSEARKNGIGTKYTKEACLKKAKLCQSRIEFYKKFRNYYRHANYMGILDGICTHMKETSFIMSENRQKYSLEPIVKLVKKNNWSKIELRKHHPELMNWVYKNKQIKSIPFKKSNKNITLKEIEDLIKKNGISHKNEYKRYVLYKISQKKNSYGWKEWVILVQNPKTKMIMKTCIKTLRLNKSPFFKKQLSGKILISKINECGKKFIKSEQFKYKNMICSKKGRIEIVHINSKKIKQITIQSILNGGNPFSKKIDLHEKEIVCKKLESFFFKKKLKFDKEFNLFSKRPDYVVSDPYGRKLIVEAKSWKKKWSPSVLEKQLNNYKILGKKKFGSHYVGSVIVCLQGKHGITLEALNAMLKNKKFILKKSSAI